jgi:hypothetical protein
MEWDLARVHQTHLIKVSFEAKWSTSHSTYDRKASVLMTIKYSSLIVHTLSGASFMRRRACLTWNYPFKTLDN